MSKNSNFMLRARLLSIVESYWGKNMLAYQTTKLTYISPSNFQQLEVVEPLTRYLKTRTGVHKLRPVFSSFVP